MDKYRMLYSAVQKLVGRTPEAQEAWQLSVELAMEKCKAAGETAPQNVGKPSKRFAMVAVTNLRYQLVHGYRDSAGVRRSLEETFCQELSQSLRNAEKAFQIRRAKVNQRIRKQVSQR